MADARTGRYSCDLDLALLASASSTSTEYEPWVVTTEGAFDGEDYIVEYVTESETPTGTVGEGRSSGDFYVFDVTPGGEATVWDPESERGPSAFSPEWFDPLAYLALLQEPGVVRDRGMKSCGEGECRHLELRLSEVASTTVDVWVEPEGALPCRLVLVIGAVPGEQLATGTATLEFWDHGEPVVVGPPD